LAPIGASKLNEVLTADYSERIDHNESAANHLQNSGGEIGRFQPLRKAANLEAFYRLKLADILWEVMGGTNGGSQRRQNLKEN
jgi:hypothetical protein